MLVKDKVKYTIQALEEKFRRLKHNEILVVVHNQHHYYILNVDATSHCIELISASSLLYGSSPENCEIYQNHVIVAYGDSDDELYADALQQGIMTTYKKELVELIHWDAEEVPLVHFYTIALREHND